MSIKKTVKLAKMVGRIEAKLTPLDRLKLARKKLIRVAGVDDPQSYGTEKEVQKDKSKESSEQKEDKNIEKHIKEVSKDDDERFVTAKKKTKLAQEFEEQKHPRDSSGQFTSGGGEGGSSKEEESSDKTEDDSSRDSVSKETLSSIRDVVGEDVNIEEVQEGAVAGNGRLITMDDGSEWAQYDSEEDAREAAKEQMEQLYDDIGIEGWNPEFAEQFITMTPTDKRLFAQDVAEADRDFFEDEVREEGLEGDEFDSEVEERISAKSDEIEQNLDDDLFGTLEEYGYDSDTLKGKDPPNFISIDTDGLFEESINTDGIAHTLASYDGEEVESKDGKLLYRIN